MDKGFSDSELVLGLVGAVGTQLPAISSILKNKLEDYGYSVVEVHVAKDVIPSAVRIKNFDPRDECQRINCYMDSGNKARRKSQNNSILALGTAAWIAHKRKQQKELEKRTAYIVRSLKHPNEVTSLRQIYPQGFYLLGVHSEQNKRLTYLERERRIDKKNALKLMARDEDEHLKHGQRLRDTFHMSDFFIRHVDDEEIVKINVWRILEVLFGHPFRTPTFDEYAMFLAFSASLRSASLSRQVGAVIADSNDEIIATGSNDVPKYRGGLYWSRITKGSEDDREDGRDYTRKYDSNAKEKSRIVESIIEKIGPNKLKISKTSLRRTLNESAIANLTEYGREVHAEMEALLTCARTNNSTRGGTLYCTTFPCHNCTKHIIASGIARVVYVEPYEKSKAVEFHSDAITLGFNGDEDKINFHPFVGVGPRRFFDLFSIHLGSGYTLKRKDSKGNAIVWEEQKVRRLRTQMMPDSYLELEHIAAKDFDALRERIGE